LYIGKERIAEVDQGIQFQNMEEDGGHLKERIHRTIESGIYNQWQHILRHNELLMLYNKENTSEDSKHSPSGLDAILALYFFALLTAVVTFEMELIIVYHLRVWRWASALCRSVRFRKTKLNCRFHVKRMWKRKWGFTCSKIR
jgi:hypothetical protein